MTYHTTPQEDLHDALADTFGEEYDIPREARRFVDEADVSDPDVPVFLGRYGNDDPGRWSPGSHGE